MCAITLITITSNVKTAHLPLGNLLGKMPLVGSCLSLHQCLYIDWAMGVSWVMILTKGSVHFIFNLICTSTDGVKLFWFFCKKRFSCLCFYCRSWCLYRVADILNITVLMKMIKVTGKLLTNVVVMPFESHAMFAPSILVFSFMPVQMACCLWGVCFFAL